MTDYERVRNAMRIVFSHKVGDVECMASEVWDLLAETAVKTMYLIDAENERKNAL